MQTEIEAKFLNVNHNDIRNKLKKLGAICEQPMRLMRRSILDYPDRRMQVDQDAWVRVRDEGDKITVTFKQVTEKSLGGAKEIETTAGSFEKIRDIFLAIGLVEHSFQESKRETWKLGEAEIVLDEWPWLNPYIEVEADSKDKVKSAAKQIGFEWEDACFGSVTTAYRMQYPGISKSKHVSTIERITFDEPRPDWFTK